jgi:hypothetical protein
MVFLGLLEEYSGVLAVNNTNMGLDNAEYIWKLTWLEYQSHEEVCLLLCNSTLAE